MKKTEFIERIAGYVEKYAYVYGIMVHSPIIAQAILESGWGESKLASLYHNDREVGKHEDQRRVHAGRAHADPRQLPRV